MAHELQDAISKLIYKINKYIFDLPIHEIIGYKIMDAKARYDYLRITSSYTFEGIAWIEVPCQDYDHFASLPPAVEVDGKVLGKMSWNSDKYYAVYNSRALIAKIR
jgi:hypothetical protein